MLGSCGVDLEGVRKICGEREDIIIRSRSTVTKYGENGKPISKVVEGTAVRYNETNGTLTDLSTGEKYVGKDSYILSTQTTLNSLFAIGDDRVKDVVSALTAPGSTHEISNLDLNTQPDGSQILGSYNRPTNGKNTFMKYALSEDNLVATGRSPEEVMGHEFKHRYNIVKGYRATNLIT